MMSEYSARSLETVRKLAKAGIPSCPVSKDQTMVISLKESTVEQLKNLSYVYAGPGNGSMLTFDDVIKKAVACYIKHNHTKVNTYPSFGSELRSFAPPLIDSISESSSNISISGRSNIDSNKEKKI